MSRGVSDTRWTGRESQSIEACLQGPEEGMALTDDLRPRHRLEAAHAAESPCELVMRLLDVLLLHCAHSVFGLWDDGISGRRKGRILLGTHDL